MRIAKLLVCISVFTGWAQAQIVQNVHATSNGSVVITGATVNHQGATNNVYIKEVEYKTPGGVVTVYVNEHFGGSANQAAGPWQHDVEGATEVRVKYGVGGDEEDPPQANNLTAWELVTVPVQ